ncbi:MAG: hypothetical protein IJ689_07735 [Alphaproteobacteria bacterium]|nr:hypothetical protein [Alphaproteobacteria bacterium]MBR1649466.1 hypothetical protein [Alphaproteobacteria bacterium]
MWPFSKKEKLSIEIDHEIYRDFCVVAAKENINDVLERLMKHYIKSGGIHCESKYENEQLKNKPPKKAKPSAPNKSKEEFDLRMEYLINGVECSAQDFEKQLQGFSCTVDVTLFYRNQTSEKKLWRVNNFTAKSSLRANLFTGYLRNWKEKNISGIKLEMMKPLPE